MEKESCGYFNSPVIRRNTPIKRLGLSRKRKSCGSESSPDAKIPACDEKLLQSPLNEEFALDNEVPRETKDCETENYNSAVNYEREIELLKVKISNQEEKLITLQSNKLNIKELEDLIEIWKSGCKNAFLHFIQLIKDRTPENVNLKTILNKLGILEAISENFQNDPEIFF